MKIYLIGVILLVSLFANSSALQNRTLIDYRLKHNVSPFADPSAADCTSTGLACFGCYKLFYCASSGAQPEVMGICPAGTICDAVSGTTGGCITPPTYPTCSPTNQIEFPCSQPGMFPDPGDCKDYHICYKTSSGALAADRNTCVGEIYGYNPRTTYCNKQLTSGKCYNYPYNYPIPLCKSEGQMGSVSDNPTIFYTCWPHKIETDVLYPYQSICPNGQIWYSGGCR